MAGIDFVVDCFPLVQITNRGATDADYADLFARLSGLLAQRERFVCVVGATGFAFPSVSQRKIIADWIPSVTDRLREQSLGCALITESSLQRGAITALNWIMRPEIPMGAFEARPEALAWCRDRLVEAGIRIPVRLDQMFQGERVAARRAVR